MPNMASCFVECCFGRSDIAFWVPVLPSGIFCKDLARGIKEMFTIQKSDIYLSDPVTGMPFKGGHWIMPFEPVRVWIAPLGELPASLCSGSGDTENMSVLVKIRNDGTGDRR